MAIRVLVVDGVRILGEGIACALAGDRRLDSVVGTAGSREWGVRMDEFQPDVVLMRVATREDMATLRAIATTTSRVRVIALGATDTEDEVIACAEAGAAGYLPRDGTLEDLTNIITSVAGGETVCSPRVAVALLRRVAALAAERRAWNQGARLTAREWEIVQLIDHGLSNKEIARQLVIEVRTVKNHVHNILEKLQVHRRGEAAARIRGEADALHSPRSNPALGT